MSSCPEVLPKSVQHLLRLQNRKEFRLNTCKAEEKHIVQRYQIQAFEKLYQRSSAYVGAWAEGWSVCRTKMNGVQALGLPAQGDHNTCNQAQCKFRSQRSRAKG